MTRVRTARTSNEFGTSKLGGVEELIEIPFLCYGVQPTVFLEIGRVLCRLSIPQSGTRKFACAHVFAGFSSMASLLCLLVDDCSS